MLIVLEGYIRWKKRSDEFIVVFFKHGRGSEEKESKSQAML
jgi:hypothetical protein